LNRRITNLVIATPLLTRCHADDYRAETDQGEQARRVPDCWRGGYDTSIDQIHTPAE